MDEYFRFSIRIAPRIYHLAGFELSTGIQINPVPPELAALRLREEK
jgi:UDPglucose--hexose-1-phosphate uridylyltransferase